MNVRYSRMRLTITSNRREGPEVKIVNRPETSLTSSSRGEFERNLPRAPSPDRWPRKGFGCWRGDLSARTEGRRPEPFSQATSRSESCELGRRRHAGPHSCPRWQSALELLTINLEREY